MVEVEVVVEVEVEVGVGVVVEVVVEVGVEVVVVVEVGVEVVVVVEVVMTIQAPEQSDIDWIAGLIHKHPCDALSILGELLKAGIRDGRCSVNDVQTIPSDKGVTGAVMKLLKELGFEHTEEKIQDMRLGKKGKVSVWKLVDKSKVETYLDANLQYWTVLLNKPLPEHHEPVLQREQRTKRIQREEPY